MLLKPHTTQNPSLIEALVFALNTAQHKSAQKKKWELVLRLGRRSLELQPIQARTLSNLAVAALRTNQLNQAMDWSEKAVKYEPKDNQILNNHGSILQECGDFKGAKEIYLRVLKKDPKHPYSRSNLGCLEHQTGNLHRALANYKTHLHHYPNDTRVWVNMAGVLLTQKHWSQGWDAYQHRLKDPNPIMKVPKNLRLWQYADETVHRLVVVHEQGLGDSFQFSRFLSKIPKNVDHVVFSGPSKLFGLLKHSKLVETCWDTEKSELRRYENDFSAQDRWIPLMCLAPLLQKQEEIEYLNTPYLFAKAKSIQHWKNILRKPNQRPLIALHWQGNPEHEMTLSRGRSIPLQELEPLLNVEGLEWLSLQKGPGSEQLDSLQWRQRFHQRQSVVDDCWDFQETASILMNCDLVITSDSGLAHLAAGLGRPTWILLMQIPEWRWGLEGSTTPWYQNMRLFRQQARNDWAGLIQKQVRPALKQWLKQQRICQ